MGNSENKVKDTIMKEPFSTRVSKLFDKWSTIRSVVVDSVVLSDLRDGLGTAVMLPAPCKGYQYVLDSQKVASKSTRHIHIIEKGGKLYAKTVDELEMGSFGSLAVRKFAIPAKVADLLESAGLTVPKDKVVESFVVKTVEDRLLVEAVGARNGVMPSTSVSFAKGEITFMVDSISKIVNAGKGFSLVVADPSTGSGTLPTEGVVLYSSFIKANIDFAVNHLTEYCQEVFKLEGVDIVYKIEGTENSNCLYKLFVVEKS